MNVAEYYLTFLNNHGCQYAFGVPGKAIMPFWQACLTSKVKLVLARHESGAAFMADGWSRGTLKPAIVLTTLGPGVTNVITGIATAYCDSIPLILITGQSETNNLGLGNFQDSTSIGRGTDVNSLLKPITKLSLEAHTSVEAINYLKIAYKYAVSGRMGPVHISIPMDIQLEEVIDDVETDSYVLNTEKNYFESNNLLVTDILEQSERPIILAGWGTYLAGSSESLMKFSLKFNIPIISTIKGKAVLATTFQNYIGHIGAGSTEITKKFLAKYSPDLFLILGSALGKMNLTPIDQYIRKAKIVQVDIEPTEMTTLIKVDKFLNCDVESFLRVNIKGKGIKPNPQKFLIWKDIYDQATMGLADENFKDTPFSFKVIDVLNKVVPSETIFLPDAGNHWLVSLNRTITKSAASFFTGIGLASMGQAIGCAIGLKLAFPCRPVVCITGDGSMLMYGSEVSTAVDLKLPIIYLVFNNASLGRILKAQKEDFDDNIGSVFIPRVNFVQWAKSLGANAFKLDRVNEKIEIEIKRCFDLKRPTVIEVDFPEVNEIPL